MHVFGQIQFSRSPLTPPEVLSRAYYHRRAANFQRHNSVRGRKRRNVECLCSNNLEIAARTRTKLPKMAEARQDRKAVAVIGSGMAGLVVAYLIQQDKHSRYDVQIFETQDRLSLDSASYTIPSLDGENSLPDRVDIPMRVLDNGFHVQLKRMYDFLGIGYTRQKFIYLLSKSSADNEKRRPYFLHSSSNHQVPPLRLRSQGYVEWVMQMIYLATCYFWFAFCCFYVKPKTDPISNEDETLRTYLERIRLPQRYVKDYFLPLMSGVTTCPHDALLDFPAIDITGYARGTYRQPHYAVLGGVQVVEKKVAKNLTVNLRATVTLVKNIGARSQVTWVDFDGESHSADFDHVIMAVTPNVVGALYGPLREAMKVIPVFSGESVVHRDQSVIAECSESLKRVAAKAQGDVQVVHVHSNLQSTETAYGKASVFVTNFPVSLIKPDQIVHRARLNRVLRTPQSRRIINEIFAEVKKNSTLKDPEKDQIWRNGTDNVWLVGSWCWDGMVLLEGCVVSAMRVATSLGVDIPWMDGQ
ncbi:hypothetical protein TMatcc_006670 [Talaromyces marneffei ATCC 18224]|nr:hypothetical protein EYB25_002383 [Talaromyces marneffei]